MRYYLIRLSYKILNTYLNKEYNTSKDISYCDYVRKLQDIMIKLNCIK